MDARFFVGDYLVEPLLNRIEGPGGPAEVEPKVMHVLQLLAGEPGHVITREHFLEEVWTGTVVNDHVLTRAISLLREAFHDSFRAPAYIQTVPKTGYRLIAPVVPMAEAGDGRPAFAGFSGDALPASVAPPHLEARPVVADAGARRGGRRLGKLLRLVGLPLVLVGSTAWFTYRHAAPSSAPLLAAVPATSTPGLETTPQLSPDGALLVFTKQDDAGQTDLFVKQVGTATTHPLTNGPEAERFPTWMPDGRTVVFQRNDGEKCGLYAVPALGGAERKLTACPVTQFGLSVSPDGRWFAVSDRPTPESARGVFLLDTATFERHRLTAPTLAAEVDFSPMFSPDGRAVAFLRGLWTPGAAFVDLHVVPVGGTAPPRRLTFDRTAISGFAWTPDGAQLLLSSNRTGAFRLWRLPASGGPLAPLPGLSTYDPGEPTIASRGGQLAYAEWFNEVNVWEFSLADAAAPVPRLRSTRWDHGPRYAPDGQRIAFVSNRAGSNEVWVARRDGADAVQLTSMNNLFVGLLRWSPDGKQLVFSARPDDHAALFLLDAEGGVPQRLATGPGDALAPSFSRDGRWIYFASNRDGAWQIWKTSLAGGDARRVTEHGGFEALEALGGDTLYYTRQGVPGLWQKVLPDGSEERRYPALDVAGWGRWDLGEAGLYFLSHAPATAALSPTGQTLSLLDVSTGAVRPLLDLGERYVGHLPGFSVSPDRRTVLLSLVDRHESDIMLVEAFR